MKSIKRMLKGEYYYNLKFPYVYFRKYFYLYKLTDSPNLYWKLRRKIYPLLDSLKDFTKEENNEIG